MKPDFYLASLFLVYSLTVDKRNQSFKPTQGHIVSFNQSIPIIQDSSSFLNGITASKYKDFSEDLIGSLKIYARAINGVDPSIPVP